MLMVQANVLRLGMQLLFPNCNHSEEAAYLDQQKHQLDFDRENYFSSQHQYILLLPLKCLLYIAHHHNQDQ